MLYHVATLVVAVDGEVQAHQLIERVVGDTWWRRVVCVVWMIVLLLLLLLLLRLQVIGIVFVGGPGGPDPFVHWVLGTPLAE